MNNQIAYMSVFGQRPGEESFEITVEIGLPYRCGEEPEDWACSVAVRPLYQNLRDVHGQDSLQSLCLAISLVRYLLQDFREKGGYIIHENGQPFSFESYSFGIEGWRVREPDPPLTEEQLALVSKLSEADVKRIDNALLSNACRHWRKVARVVGTTMMEMQDRVSGIPDIYYSQRVSRLVEEGRLESQGNLAYMGFSEVRLPSK